MKNKCLSLGKYPFLLLLFLVSFQDKGVNSVNYNNHITEPYAGKIIKNYPDKKKFSIAENSTIIFALDVLAKFSKIACSNSDYVVLFECSSSYAEFLNPEPYISTPPEIDYYISFTNSDDDYVFIDSSRVQASLFRNNQVEENFIGCTSHEVKLRIKPNWDFSNIEVTAKVKKRAKDSRIRDKTKWVLSKTEVLPDNLYLAQDISDQDNVFSDSLSFTYLGFPERKYNLAVTEVFEITEQEEGVKHPPVSQPYSFILTRKGFNDTHINSSLTNPWERNAIGKYVTEQFFTIGLDTFGPNRISNRIRADAKTKMPIVQIKKEHYESFIKR